MRGTEGTRGIPEVAGNGTTSADDEASECALRVILVAANGLGASIGDEVDDQNTEELRDPWPTALRATVRGGKRGQRTQALPYR